MRLASAAILVVLVWASTAGSVLAQAGAGQIKGAVRKPDGTAAAGAMVTATSTTLDVGRTAVTDRDGGFTITPLPPGTFRVTVSASGFPTVAHDGVVVHTGENVHLDVVLKAGSATETITVTAQTPLLQSDTSSLGQVIEHRTVNALPLNGRTFVSLAALAPSVALPPGTVLPRINGGRPRTNEYLFDGISVLQPEPGQVAFFPIIDAIQDFKIESNSPPAEFGRFNGGVVNLTTKSGSNVTSGDVFEYVRNEALNARNFFARSAPTKPKFRRGQFGGVLGGPLAARTFYFVDYQGQRQDIGRTVTSTVPTLPQRQGVFTEAVGGKVPTIFDPLTTVNGVRTAFQDNSINPDRFDPVAKVLLARYPLPTSSGTANNYTRVGDEIDNQQQGDIRIDHRFSGDRDSMFGRLTYFRDDFTPVTPLPDGSGVTSGTLGPQRTTAWAFASSYLHVFSPHWLNELRLGDTRRAVSRRATTMADDAQATLGLPGIPTIAQFPTTLPTFQISGYQQLGSPANTSSNFRTDVTEVADSLTWLHGRHTVKFGADLRWERLDVVQPPSPTGLFTFTNLFTDQPGVAGTGSPLASFLLGQVQTFSIDLQQNAIRNRAHIAEFFVQDDWRATSQLTVNAGVRYTLNFPSTEASNQAAVFNLETQQLEFLGQNGVPESARRLHGWDFGPRVGAALRLTPATVVRGGYGLVWIEQAGITTPFTTPSFPFLQTVSQRTLDNITPAFVLVNGPSVAPIALSPAAGIGQGVFAVNAQQGSGYVRQWNAAVQRELVKGLTVEVAYVGSVIHNVGVPDANINQLTVEQLSQGATLLQKVANPFFGVIPRSSSLGDPTITVAQLLKPYPMYTAVSLYRNNIGTTSYRGASIKIEQRLSHGLSWLVSYTRSRLVDDASSVFDASILTGPQINAPVADAFNRALDRDVSSGDIPNVLVANVVWDLPAGAGRPWHPRGFVGVIVNDWTLSAIVTSQSGLPLAVTQSINFNAFAGFGTQRPTLVAGQDPTLPADQRTAAQWFNTAAFAVTPQFKIGTASRNPVRGPAYRNIDLAISRRVALAGRAAFELRVEVFNLLNTVQLGAPNVVLGTPGFGSITTALDPRVVQLAVKVLF